VLTLAQFSDCALILTSADAKRKKEEETSVLAEAEADKLPKAAAEKKRKNGATCRHVYVEAISVHCV
jgi:hypothetical protein